MFVALTQSFKSLRSNPARTALTTLGIVIGIATVILVLSAGAGFRSLIDAQVATLGTNTLFIQTRVPSANKSRSVSPGGGEISGVAITTLKQRDLDTIKTLPNVVNDYGIVTGQAVASYRDNKKSVIYFGASASRFDIDKTTLKEGRFYTQAEDIGGAQVVVLGNNLASSLFNQDDPVGKLLHLGTLNFLVVGVYNPSNGLGGGVDDLALIPLGTAQKKLLGVDYVTRVIVQLQNPNLGDATAEQIRSTLRHNHNITDPAKDDFAVSTQTDALSTFNAIFGGLTALLVSIAAISLVVGGVGIMNIMYVIVTERTAEIGLKKALGAKPSDILNEFLIEAVMVTLLGGALGIAAGSGLSWLVAAIATAGHLAWTFSVPAYAIAIGFGVSAAIGISFGVLPARSAAKLDPIQALRYE